MIRRGCFYLLVSFFCFIVSCSKADEIDVCVVDFSNELSFRPQYRTILTPESEESYNRGFITRCKTEVDSFFQILSDEVCALEQNFMKIQGIQGKAGTGCGVSNYKFSQSWLEGHAFQYAGVIIKRKKYVFINAFALDQFDRTIEDFPTWKEEFLDPYID